MRLLLPLLLLCAPLAFAEDWPQFRGPAGLGISDAGAPPIHLSTTKNVVWKTATPPGGSSPILTADRIFLTAYEDERLYVLGLNRDDGKILWRREVPRPRQEIFNKTHGPASPTPVTDGGNVYAFFGDFGLISFDANGRERWRLPLGPFLNVNGHGSSPIVVGQKLILVVDQSFGSYLLALDKDTGKQIWKADRSDITSGYGTPALFEPSDGPAQLVVPGAYQTASYDLQTGDKLWYVRRMAWQLKCVPVIDGDTIYINSWESGGDPGQRRETAPWAEALAAGDADGDGRLSRDEIAEKTLKSDRGWLEHDLDADGYFSRRDWEFYAARRAPENSLLAIRPAGRRGDLTDSAVLWRYTKSLPNTPSPLLLDGLLYIVKDGGIFQSIDPATGAPHKLARLGPDAVDRFWASPVAAGGKIYMVNQACTVTVVRPGKQWEVLAVNPLEGFCLSTPALADGRIFIRSDQALWAFGNE